MSTRSEPITVNKALAWAVGIIGSVATLAGCAAASALWNQGQAITRIDTNYANLTKQLEALTVAVAAGTQNRYTASDAASDRAAFFKALDTSYTTTSNRIDALQKAKDDQGQIIADLRVQIARMGGKP